MKKLCVLIFVAVLVYYGLSAVIETYTKSGIRYAIQDVQNKAEMIGGKR